MRTHMTLMWTLVAVACAASAALCASRFSSIASITVGMNLLNATQVAVRVGGDQRPLLVPLGDDAQTPSARFTERGAAADGPVANASGFPRALRRSGPRRVRALHYNILDGAVSWVQAAPHGGGGAATRRRRLDEIEMLIRDGAYDLVSLNELNGIDAAALRALGARVNMPHALLLAKSRYHLGLLSREPLEAVAQERAAPFAHGLLCARHLSTGLEVCVTHLDPHSTAQRAREAERIAERASAAAARGRPFVLLGDLNTLSPLDEREHVASGLLGRIGSGPRRAQLLKKFTASPRGGAARIDYAPMRTLLASGLRDLGAEARGARHTVPTQLNADQMHFAPMRLDYCLVGDGVIGAECARAAAIGSAAAPSDVADDAASAPRPMSLRGAPAKSPPRCAAEVLRTPRTQLLSDHFPLSIELLLPGGGYARSAWPSSENSLAEPPPELANADSA